MQTKLSTLLEKTIKEILPDRGCIGCVRIIFTDGSSISIDLDTTFDTDGDYFENDT